MRDELARYGITWECRGGNSYPLHARMSDGYWTPWHVANERIEALEQALAELRASAQEWALYAFRQHGDDSRLYHGLADLGGVSRDGAGWDHARLTGGGISRHDEIAGKD